MIELDALMKRAKEDAAFQEIHQRFGEAGIQNWLLEEEKSLLFAVGAFAPGEGIIVEIGSFEGGSATFFAAGIARRGEGQLSCLDLHLGGPPWLGMAPYQRTLDIFRRKVSFCQVERWIATRVGDSAAIAAVWPAKAIDAVFIDGDHSFRGALRDYECWFTKLRTGGLLIVDDADDPVLTELLEFIEFVKTLSAVRHLKTIQGMAVFVKEPVEPWAALEELSVATAKLQIRRPWSYEALHSYTLPPNYHLPERSNSDHSLDVPYQLSFLAKCGSGDYGFTSASRAEDREFLRAVMSDRGDGELRQVNGGHSRATFRCILCSPEEEAEVAFMLVPGGVLIARENSADSMAIRKLLLAAGLEGCGFGGGMQWGVWKPSYLSADAVVDFSYGAL